MGTRADFYIGRGKDAQWLGSIAWDGYPSGIDEPVRQAKSGEEFVDAIGKFVAGRDDFTKPEDGWPWPWDDSGTTDYAYAFDGGQVWASPFGLGWFKADGDEPSEDLDEDHPKVEFPDMSDVKNVQFASKRSGLIVMQMRSDD